MFKKPTLILMALGLAILFTACATIQDAQKDLGKKYDKFMDKADPDLVAKVPPENLSGVDEAKTVLADVIKLENFAKLQKDLTKAQDKLASYELKKAKKVTKSKEIELNILHLEALERSDLGDQKYNAKAIADQRKKVVSIEKDIVSLNAKIETVKENVRTLQYDVDNQMAKQGGPSGTESQPEESTTESQPEEPTTESQPEEPTTESQPKEPTTESQPEEPTK